MLQTNTEKQPHRIPDDLPVAGKVIAVDVAAWLVQGCQFQRNVRELVKEPKVPVRGALEPVVRLTEFLVSKGAACIILVIDGRRYLPKEQAGVRAKRNAALAKHRAEMLAAKEQAEQAKANGMSVQHREAHAAFLKAAKGVVGFPRQDTYADLLHWTAGRPHVVAIHAVLKPPLRW